jgi:hypothetical protein
MVARIGDLQLSLSFTQKKILHVPKLTTNLVSIQKLSNDVYCYVIFNDTNCIFQDQDSGKTIGRAREHDNLYYRKSCNLNNRKSCVLVAKFVKFVNLQYTKE